MNQQGVTHARIDTFDPTCSVICIEVLFAGYTPLAVGCEAQYALVDQVQIERDTILYSLIQVDAVDIAAELTSSTGDNHRERVKSSRF